MDIHQRRINTGEQVARHMEVGELLGLSVDELFDVVDYLNGDRDTAPEITPTYGALPGFEATS